MSVSHVHVPFSCLARSLASLARSPRYLSVDLGGDARVVRNSREVLLELLPGLLAEPPHVQVGVDALRRAPAARASGDSSGGCGKCDQYPLP